MEIKYNEDLIDDVEDEDVEEKYLNYIIEMKNEEEDFEKNLEEESKFYY